jgi:hypothetical protein
VRMSALFALTSVFSAFNLVFMPFHPVMMLWAFGLSVAFIIVNIIADRLRLWSGIAWEWLPPSSSLLCLTVHSPMKKTGYSSVHSPVSPQHGMPGFSSEKRRESLS